MPALHSCLFAAALALLALRADGTCLDGLCADPNSVDVPDVDSLLQVSYRLDAAQHVDVNHHTSGEAALESKGTLEDLILKMANSVDVPDVDSLLQVSHRLDAAQHLHVDHHTSGDAALESKATLEDLVLKMANSSMADSKVPFPCTFFPRLCKEPFNCGSTTWKELQSSLKTPAGSHGGNPKTWCYYTSWIYEPYVTTCLQGDVAKGGVINFNRTLWGFYGPDTLNYDASMCFQMGFCEDETVTNETTLVEADKLCDERFGHGNWANAMAEHEAIMKKYASYSIPGKGFHHKAITNSFEKMACAMGNYHCDVMYCKVGYCKDPHFIKKFGYMRPSSYEEAKYYEGPTLVEASSKLT